MGLLYADRAWLNRWDYRACESRTRAWQQQQQQQEVMHTNEADEADLQACLRSSHVGFNETSSGDERCVLGNDR